MCESVVWIHLSSPFVSFLDPFCSAESSFLVTASQGSEEDTVVYVVGKAGRQHWQHVYTAVTRGRCRVYVIAEESQLQNAIRKNSVPRKTRLKHFLQNKLSTSHEPAGDLASQLKNAGDGGGPSTPPSASPLPTASTITPNVAWSKSSVAEDRTFTWDGEWQLSSFDTADADEDQSQSRGSKRTCGTNDSESPSKVLMVGSGSQTCSYLFPLQMTMYFC